MEGPEDEFMRVQSSIQTARKQHLHNMCRNYYNHTPKPIDIALHSREMLVIERHKIVMCVTAKVGGKTWKRVLNVLAGISNTTDEDESWRAVINARKIKRLRTYTPEKINDILQNYTLFMFSRHPLTRTLSAFNNKLSPTANDYLGRNQFWKKVGYEIMKTYRPHKVAPFNTTTYNLTFHEFVSYLIDQQKFTDSHWIENFEACRPCDIPYTIIGRFETMQEDAKYVLKFTKVDDIVNFPKSEGYDATLSSEFGKLLSAYSQIPADDLNGLFERYKPDYLLFNYSIPSTNVREWSPEAKYWM